MFHNGTHTQLNNATGNLYLTNTSTDGSVRISATSGHQGVSVRYEGAVDLYHNNTKRFSTSGIGATVFGQLDTTSNVAVGSGITLSPDGDMYAVGVSTFTDEIHLTTTGNTLRFKDDSGNQLGAIAGNSSNLGFFGNANNNGRFDFYTGGAYRFRIQPGGDINVGTAVTIGGVTGHARYTGTVSYTHLRAPETAS